jgi:hypothetical protein
MARLIFKNGSQAGQALELRAGINRIGRNPDNDVHIPDPSVSSHHCEMHVSDLGIAFRDLGSTNGSFIDGRPVVKEILTAGKTLKLGAIEFDVEIPQAVIAIPDRPKQEEVFANFLADGTQACQTHADVPATFRCTKCEKAWCDECVRRTGLVGSANQMVSCIECGGKCEKIVVFTAPKKKSFFDHIGDTIRLKRPK